MEKARRCNGDAVNCRENVELGRGMTEDSTARMRWTQLGGSRGQVGAVAAG